jgi:hypothetical protein
MTDLTKLADELAKVASNYTASMYREDSEHIREAARILRAAAAVDVAELMAMVYNHMISDQEWWKNKDDPKCAERLMETQSALESALRMALAGREEWQPIETAPKDVAVLLWGKYWNNKDVFQRPLVGQWNPIRNPQRWEALGEYRFGIRPTHWMPLPAAPKGTP